MAILKDGKIKARRNVMGKSEVVRYSVLGVVFLVIFVSLAMIPMLKRGPQRIICPNPNPTEWINAASKIDVPLQEMNTSQLLITSTAIQIESLRNIRADFFDLTKNLRGIGWTCVALFAALVLNQIVFTKR